MNPKDPYTVPLFTHDGDVNRSRLPWEPPDPSEPPKEGAAPPPVPTPLPDALVPVEEEYETGTDAHEIKSRIHKMLLERLNLSNLESYDRSQVVAEIRKVVQDLLTREVAPLNFDEREALVEQVLHEIFGLGPLEPLLQDPSVSDILVNTYKQVFIERGGRIEKTDVRFKDDKHLMQVIDRIVSAVGRRIDDSSPMVDARLADGSRVNAVIPPLAIDGPHVSIRKFKKDALSAEDLLRYETVTPPMLELLQGIIKAKLNVLISGGTGAGKTTLLNVLSSSIPGNERIVTIEDSAELQLRQPHVVRLETRPPNVEGVGQITARQLVINALRMRPDRIIVGEVRGSEAVDMMQAMNTGHDGSLTTLHANSPRDALSRLETMVSMANLNLPEKAMRQQVASALQVVIQVSRLSDGTRRLSSISEIVGMEGDVITMQEIFLFERQGIGEDGKVLGRFKATGIRPRFAERLRTAGIELPTALFSNADFSFSQAAQG
ncbi:MAG TPA: CpaF family protein [Gemmatimonadota bacterium]|nr:CpaF family protein [Gemmatimonadota bacterium]